MFSVSIIGCTLTIIARALIQRTPHDNCSAHYVFALWMLPLLFAFRVRLALKLILPSTCVTMQTSGPFLRLGDKQDDANWMMMTILDCVTLGDGDAAALNNYHCTD